MVALNKFYRFSLPQVQLDTRIVTFIDFLNMEEAKN